MKSFLPLLALVMGLIAGCNQPDTEADAAVTPLESHRQAIEKFQSGQKRFKELIAAIRDEESFDAAKPGLDQVVSDWHEVATALGGLEPPSEDQQAEFRELIDEGIRAAEPTNEDMLGLILIESREEEVTQWLEAFAAAARAAGAEVVRLYGPIHDADAEPKAPVIDTSKATINGLPVDQWLATPLR